MALVAAFFAGMSIRQELYRELVPLPKEIPRHK
jgi:hypothetical protein